MTDPPVGPLGGRPWRSFRECLEGVLWVLITGARWKALSVGGGQNGTPHQPLAAPKSRWDSQWNLPGSLGSIAEPTAAATRYLLGRSDRRRLVLTGKKGVTTWDVVIVETEPASFLLTDG